MKAILPLIATKTIRNITMMVTKEGVSTYETAGVISARMDTKRNLIVIETLYYTVEFAPTAVRHMEQATDRSVWVGVIGIREEFQLDY